MLISIHYEHSWLPIIGIHAVYLCTLFLIQSIHYPSQARCSSLFTHTFAPKGRRWMQNSFKCSFSELKILLQMAKAGSPRLLPVLLAMGEASFQYWPFFSSCMAYVVARGSLYVPHHCLRDAPSVCSLFPLLHINF